MAGRWRRGLFFLWIAFAVLWIGWTFWHSNWSGLDVFVPTTREECATELGRNLPVDPFIQNEIDECMKRGAVEIALRKSYTLEKLALIFTPPLALLVIGVVIWLIVWLIIRKIAPGTR
jgi:hypothetical protein